MKKKKNLVIIMLLLLVTLVLSLVAFSHRPHRGDTVESRQILLDRQTGNGIGCHWTIVTEREVEGYLICGAYSTDHQAAIAIFKTTGKNTYEVMAFASHDQNEVMVETAVMDGRVYDLVWFCGAQTTHAEITCTIDGQEQSPAVYDTSEMELICREAPAKEYAIRAVYFDEAGTRYESR